MKQVVDHAHAVGEMRHGVACGVAQLPFIRPVVDFLAAVFQPVAQVVVVQSGVALQCNVENAGFQSVAGVFKIFSDANFTTDRIVAIVCSRVVEPILSGDVV